MTIDFASIGDRSFREVATEFVTGKVDQEFTLRQILVMCIVLETADENERTTQAIGKKLGLDTVAMSRIAEVLFAKRLVNRRIGKAPRKGHPPIILDAVPASK
jgi:hypothetical protein